MGKRNGSDVQRQLDAIVATLNEVRDEVRTVNVNFSSFAAGTSERCKAEGDRISAVEGQQRTYGIWLVGAMLSGILALVAMLWDILTRR